MAHGDFAAQSSWAVKQQNNNYANSIKTFQAIGANEKFQQVQIQAAEKYHNDILRCLKFLRGLRSDLMGTVQLVTYCALYDLCVQQGDLSKASHEIQARVATDKPSTQIDLLKIAVQERAKKATAKWVFDSTSRRMGIIQQKVYPHPPINGEKDNPRENSNFLTGRQKKMFADCKIYLIKFLIACFAISIATSAIADEKSRAIECGSGDECTTIVPNSISEAKILCPNSPVQISWSKKSNWALISCSCNCTERNNKNWFVNKNGTVIGLEAGRYFSRSLFSSNLSPTIPDIMAPHPMCKPADRKMVDRSSFLLLDKTPSQNSDPYCYDTIYAIDENGIIVLTENGVPLKKYNPDYFYNVSTTEKIKLMSISNKIFATWSSPTDIIEFKNLDVVVDRAYLYDQPSSQGVRRAYLIKGDEISTNGYVKNGYIKIKYTPKNGATIEKWIKCEDINYCGKDH
ncbi:hypothetical protein L3V59_29680 [Burkholderia aenigmatica]|uniref:hypothetical protein n=1 Tax=Burkholderia aenigmatica TaxID=2015348 RepID=UPI001F45406D|nr:hypothetical protein [Burkholderia aenigmatica]UKD13863.1 hypothetical protein L3V59_29680 [Burkholderia aenigmatica]